MKRRRARKKGRVYSRPGSPYFWLAVTVKGKRTYRNTKLAIADRANKQLAEDALDDFRRELKLNPVPLRTQGVMVSDLAEAFLADYRMRGLRSIGHAVMRWKNHLEPFFRDCKASHVTSTMVDNYIESRLQENASPSTINRELAALKRMFRLGKRKGKVTDVPYVEITPENNTRTGFVEDRDYALLAGACSLVGPWMRAIFEIGHCYGWRKSEVLGLRVSQVDLRHRSLRLEPLTTKNGEGREVYLTDSLCALLRPLIAGKSRLDSVFTRGVRPVRSIRKTWENVCCSAGLGHFECHACGEQAAGTGKRCGTCKARLTYHGLLFHDLRRSAARNLRRAGVDVSVIKKVGGWKTDKVFSRYSIVAPSDVKDAMQKLEASRTANSATIFGDNDTPQVLGAIN